MHPLDYIEDSEPIMKLEEIMNTVIQGDCLQVMREFEDKSIDLTLTDPPYNAKNIGPNARVYEG